MAVIVAAVASIVFRRLMHLLVASVNLVVSRVVTAGFAAAEFAAGQPWLLEPQ
jgi:hypothetical protein